MSPDPDDTSPPGPPSGSPPGSPVSDLFAPDGGWRVRILDLSGAELAGFEAGTEAAGTSDGNVVEEIAGFPTLMQANAFARRYVRDSVERCRNTGMAPREVLEAWFAFGEDATVVDAGEDGWRSAPELAGFADRPAAPEDRDWRALDPRRAGDPDAEDDEPDEAGPGRGRPFPEDDTPDDDDP